MKLKMDWMALCAFPLWQQLWKQSEITDKIAAIENRLTLGSVTDPHELGLLRGQLRVYKLLPEIAQNMAKIQHEEMAKDEVPEAPDPRKRWGLLTRFR